MSDSKILSGGIFLGLPKLFITNDEYPEKFIIIKPKLCTYNIQDKIECQLTKSLKCINSDGKEITDTNENKSIVSVFIKDGDKNMHVWLLSDDYGPIIDDNDKLLFTLYDFNLSNNGEIVDYHILDSGRMSSYLKLDNFPIIIKKLKSKKKTEIITDSIKQLVDDNDLSTKINLDIIDDRLYVSKYDIETPTGLYYNQLPPKIKYKGSSIYVDKKLITSNLEEFDRGDGYYDYYNNCIIINSMNMPDTLIINRKTCQYKLFKQLNITYGPYSGLYVSSENSDNKVAIGILFNDEFYRIGIMSNEMFGGEDTHHIIPILENPDNNEDTPVMAQFLNNIINTIPPPICNIIAKYCVLVISNGLDITKEFADRYRNKTK